MNTRAKPTFKASDLKRAVQTLQAVGLDISGARISLDGTIEVLTANAHPVISGDDALSRWEREHGSNAA